LPESVVAALVFRSVRCFRTLFRKNFGKSYREFRLEGKLQLARQLLQTSRLSISEIASELGYASRRKFEQAFKKRFERTAAQFRAESNELRQLERIAAQGLSNTTVQV
jgi:AraC-like DNA-binding protein